MSLKTELLAAIEQQNPSTVFKLLRTGLIDLQSEEYKTDNPLFKAVESGNASIVRLLVENGASYNSTDESYDSPVTAFDLAVNYDQEEIVDYFLTLEPTQAEIVSALAGVTKSQHVFDALVSRITYINGQYGDTRTTPLMAVAESTNYLEGPSTVGVNRLKRLLDLGANKELVDNMGRRARDLADDPNIKLFLTPGPATPIYSEDETMIQPTNEDEQLGCILGGVCLLIPLLGLILYFAWRNSSPQKARAAGLCAFFGFAFYLLYRMAS